MTDAEIVKVLAERDCPAGLLPATTWPIEDRNALARVIGKMTEEERFRLDDMLWPKCVEKHQIRCVNALTLDPRVIAECVAKAIQKGKA